MIWVRGDLVPDDQLAVSVLDRTFEHGLGLFETFRTWNGRPTLWPRHRERLTRAAAERGLPLEPQQLPDEDAVRRLTQANRHPGDALIRITLTGGLSPSHGSTLWMRSAALPPEVPGGIRLGPPWVVGGLDPLAGYKSLNYWLRRLAFEKARADGFDEALLVTPDHRVLEGSRTNLMVVRGGRLQTPPCDAASSPIVPGIMRAVVIERALGLGIEVREAVLTEDEVRVADEVFLTNSVRGLLPARSWQSREFPSPGPLTERLGDTVYAWLHGRDGVGRDRLDSRAINETTSPPASSPEMISLPQCCPTPKTEPGSPLGGSKTVIGGSS